ncbi:MAG: phosphoadenylyl-sulfate reductase [Bacteroidetes bacterium]|nr:MAG: phosphoadenylyl-sulfate reductase [Bacteroidota bacterium]
MNRQLADSLNEKLKNSSAVEILEFAAQEFRGKIRFASSMGVEDQVITHMIASEKVPIEIFTLDTGRMFYETYELIEKSEARYNIQVKIYFPDASEIEEMVNARGINLFYKSIENRKMCCGIRKIKPLQRALKEMEAWVTGLRREQSPTRNNMQVVEWDEANQLIKINPLLEWNEQQTWDFINEHKIPYNTLHDKGFPSIGCQPCTRAIQPGEDIRSGRWWWENPETKECGLHLKKNK